MRSDSFNPEEAKRYLLAREKKEREEQEIERKELLKKIISLLHEEFDGSGVEVYLVGSVIQPYRFTINSDVDIVLKNFTGDRFEVWSRMENKLGKKVEIIPFETCNFQEFILTEGLKVL